MSKVIFTPVMTSIIKPIKEVRGIPTEILESVVVVVVVVVVLVVVLVVVVVVVIVVMGAR